MALHGIVCISILYTIAFYGYIFFYKCKDLVTIFFSPNGVPVFSIEIAITTLIIVKIKIILWRSCG